MSQNDAIRALVEKFAEELEALIVQQITEGIKAKIALAFAGEDVTTITVTAQAVKSASSKRGRPPGSKNKKAIKESNGARKKTLAGRQVQTCPVPACKNPAAPVFGMVCEKHKKVPKAKIALHRKQRKFAKKNDLPIKTVSANWAKYRQMAG